MKIVLTTADNASRPTFKITDAKLYGRNFYDQQINESIKQYDEVGKVSTG